MNVETKNTVLVNVELFGHARVMAGVRDLELALPSLSGASDLAAALADALPSLLTVALESDCPRLLPSYTANLNGLQFLGEEPVPITPGDIIYLFSSQAGG